MVTIAQGGAAYPGDCAECSVRRMSAVPGGVACLLCRRLTLPLVCFYAPYPPSPFPGGEGGDQGYFMQGASPLASPRLSRRRHGLNLRCRCPLGGLPALSPADLAFCLLSCPLSPQPPSPAGKGVPKSLFRRGLRPRHPGTEPPTALTDPSIQVPCGKLAFLRHGFPPPRQSPKTRFPTGNASAAPVQPPGMQGAKPLA